MLAPIVLAILVAQPFPALPLAGQASGTQQPPPPIVPETPEKPWPPAGVFRPGGGVIAPRLVNPAKPSYTAEALNAKIAGIVELEAVVEIDGTVRDVHITRSLDREFGLDDEAVKILKMWRFSPGTKDGLAVPVLVAVEMSFSLRK